MVRIINAGAVDQREVGDLTDVDLTRGWPEPEVDVVIHLAALAAVGPSFDHPMDYITANSAMVVNMCESLLKGAPSTRVIMASSGAIYAASSVPISEDAPVEFSSPYAVSKVLGENLLDYYRLRGLESVSVRPFNHIGPGQGPGFLVPDLIQRLRGLGQGDALEVGNLATRRDYTDVRDVARAYVMMAEADQLGHSVYNLCSGVSRSGEEVLAEICDALGRPVPPLAVAAWANRPVDNPVVRGDYSRVEDELGWEPQISFQDSIRGALGEAG